MKDKRVYVGRFIRQEERNKIPYDYETSREANLYMKNLDESITDDTLAELFSEFGTIRSCKVRNKLSRYTIIIVCCYSCLFIFLHKLEVFYGSNCLFFEVEVRFAYIFKAYF